MTNHDHTASAGTKAEDVGRERSPETVLELCEHCGSEGRIYRGYGPYPTDYGKCPVCDGTGREEIEAFPIEMEDLDIMAGEKEPRL